MGSQTPEKQKSRCSRTGSYLNFLWWRGGILALTAPSARISLGNQQSRRLGALVVGAVKPKAAK